MTVDGQCLLDGLRYRRTQSVWLGRTKSIQSEDLVAKFGDRDSDGAAVSVLVLTCNHEDYIAHCLRSILEQETNFPVQVLVHDDASEDNTPHIVSKFAEQYPRSLHYIRSASRLGVTGPIVQTLFAKATGTFVAWCEGDDYWIERDKLARQVKQLTDDKSLVAVSHSTALVRNGIVSVEEPLHSGRLRKGTLKGYLDSLPPVSICMRRHSDFPANWCDRAPYGDAVLKSWLCSKGDVFVDSTYVGAAHVLHEGGVFSGRDEETRLRLTEDSLLIAAEFLQSVGDLSLAKEAGGWALAYANRRARLASGGECRPVDLGSGGIFGIMKRRWNRLRRHLVTQRRGSRQVSSDS